ncbi:uncharacterized protein LOC122640109 [Telopea speciosissima]|uniref:uncharacterized protein LOC122640109 n=1 Tax=Telopea speciosissima TaxID=54955 RepID=UPI001CC7BC8F|nr:uncharacterized protein LOC122640109 [Telopea speciosissima]
MEKPNFNPEAPTLTTSTLQVLSPSSSGRRSSASNSSEFEFWMVRNPSFPQPQILSADELFVDGVLLPLHLLRHHSDPPDPEEHKANSETPNPEPEPEPESEPGPGPQSSAVLLPELSTGLTTSKRWRDIFKIGEKRTTATTSSAGVEDREKDKDKEKKKERKTGGGSASGAELNINLWPFSRSRSAGNGGNRPKLAVAATRKVSSAPCSRSNSAGESKSRRWPSSPGRVGFHLGRTSPVWQIRRGGSGVRSSDLTEPVVVGNVDKGGTSKSSEPVANNEDKGRKKETKETRRSKNNGGGGGGGSKARVLNLNVPMCIGYRQHLSCRSDQNGTVGGEVGGGSESQSSSGAAGNSGSGGSLLNLRTIFSKKVY